MVQVGDKEISVSGRFPRVARLHAEYHEYLDDPVQFLTRLNKSRVRADLFTFVQPATDTIPRHTFSLQPNPVAVLRIDTYETWWKHQINDKTRNMVRKAGKKGVTVQEVEFNDELVKGIQVIYNESPLRQGKLFKHYGKDLETLKKAHESYLDRSVFIGAFYDGALIGFIKMIIHGNTSASIMQILSMILHRDKAPTNVLLAKAVEICAQRGVHYLQYGIWSRRGIGDFKLHHGFKRVELPRYFVPLNIRGRIALALKLHHDFIEILPGNVIDILAEWRAKLYSYKYRSST